MDFFVSTKANIEQDCLSLKSLRTNKIRGQILIGVLGLFDWCYGKDF